MKKYVNFTLTLVFVITIAALNVTNIYSSRDKPTFVKKVELSFLNKPVQEVAIIHSVDTVYKQKVIKKTIHDTVFIDPFKDNYFDVVGNLNLVSNN